MYVFVMYYNQESINLFLAWYDSQPVRAVNVYTVFTVNILLFTSISYVQENFKLKKVNHG